LFNFASCREHAAGVSTVLSVIRAFERADNAPMESLRNRFQETVFRKPFSASLTAAALVFPREGSNRASRRLKEL